MDGVSGIVLAAQTIFTGAWALFSIEIPGLPGISFGMLLVALLLASVSIRIVLHVLGFSSDSKG